MLTVSSIAHVAIRVKDVARALDFYVGRLGMREMMRLDRDGRLWLLYLRVTDTQFLEVFPTLFRPRPSPAWRPAARRRP